MFDPQTIIDTVQGMRHNMDNTLGLQIVHQVEYVIPAFLDVAMLTLVDVKRQNVQFAAVLGEIGCNFLADEGIRQVSDFQGPFDAVVIRNGDMGHAALAGDAVDLEGLGEAFRTADFFQDPGGRPFGMFGMHMAVNTHLQFLKFRRHPMGNPF